MDKLLRELEDLMGRIEKLDRKLYEDCKRFIRELQEYAEKQYRITFPPSAGWIDPFNGSSGAGTPKAKKK